MNLLVLMNIDGELKENLELYAHAIHNSNKRFNLTGHTSIDEIYQDLIVRSIKPISEINVPRGTTCIDLGSGSGIPGIPVALYFPQLSVTLIEVNEKKAFFLKSIISRLSIQNISVVCERAEDVASDPDFIEKFNFLLSRAFQNIYITLEIGASFLTIGGMFYIYSNKTIEEIPSELLCHIQELGLSSLSYNYYETYHIEKCGLLFRKEKKTPSQFPRSYSVMKRKSKNITE